MPIRQTTLLFQVATPGLERRGARAFAKRLESEVAGGRSFCCLITNDNELRRLNRQFRKKDYATDVLSFPAIEDLDSVLGEPAGGLGDLAISFDKAKQQAVEHHHAVGEEIAVLMLHGVLHLMGMDHETDHGQMARAERKWRSSLGLRAGLIERRPA
jgi:probable rRNA maturation factor